MKKILIVIVILFSLISACQKHDKFTLQGAGATFPFPLYNRMFSEFYRETGVDVNYQAIGSGAGIKRFLDRQLDFGASDSYLSDREMAEYDNEILHIPICLGAVAVSYNLDLSDTLRLTPSLLSYIFKGEINQWDDPRIKQINPGIVFPQDKIKIIVRSDASGTTEIFTEYLSRIDPEWDETTGSGKKVIWVKGEEIKGNFGVAAKIRDTSGSIGYLEKIYAQQNEMSIAKIQNKKGNYIYPDPQAVSLAADIGLPADTRIKLIDPSSLAGYPISSFSWILIYKELDYLKSRVRATNTAKLIHWMLTDGQKYAEEIGYSPLPHQVIEKAKKQLTKITYNQENILK